MAPGSHPRRRAWLGVGVGAWPAKREAASGPGRRPGAARAGSHAESGSLSTPTPRAAHTSFQKGPGTYPVLISSAPFTTGHQKITSLGPSSLFSGLRMMPGTIRKCDVVDGG